VEDVSLPQWVQGDAYKLVQHFREAIESPYVSSNLHSWIDYIYGSKQRGQEAVMSLNTFSKMTYTTDSPEDFNILETEDEGMRQAQMAQMYHFGQTPTQLFKAGERHPARLPIGQALRSSLVVDSEARLKVFKPVCNQQAAVHGRAG
jgi:beige protein homolog 1